MRAVRCAAPPPAPSQHSPYNATATHTHTHVSTPTRADFNLFRFVLSMQMPSVSGFDKFPTARSVIKAFRNYCTVGQALNKV